MVNALLTSACQGYGFCKLLQLVATSLNDVFTSDDAESNVTTGSMQQLRSLVVGPSARSPGSRSFTPRVTSDSGTLFSEFFCFTFLISFQRRSIFTHISTGGWTKSPLEAQFHTKKLTATQQWRNIETQYYFYWKRPYIVSLECKTLFGSLVYCRHI
jgi:hypothetical protein